MVIQTILLTRYEGSEWTLDGDDYEGLTWLSDSPKPTKKELQDSWASVKAEVEAKAKAKVDARASALAKLAALGLTESEIAAL
jgi:hypothetical protein